MAKSWTAGFEPTFSQPLSSGNILYHLWRWMCISMEARSPDGASSERKKCLFGWYERWRGSFRVSIGEFPNGELIVNE